MMKTCSKCKAEKDLDLFSKGVRHSDGKMAWCKECCAAYQAKHRPDYYKFNKAKCDENSKFSNRRLRDRVIDGYGAKCTCCGQSTRNFLSIEHVNGGGNKHRQSVHNNQRKIYNDIIRDGFPDAYTLLCFNCNLSRGFYGYCCNPPHHQALITP